MIPLRDNIPSRTTPVVTYGIIVVCVLAFLAQLAGDRELVERYGMIPARVVDPDQRVEIVVGVRPVLTPRGVERVPVRRPAAPSAVPEWMTMLTSVFLHGGWIHLLSNMWFLFIFGDNVEDCFGHFGYLIFYLGCGVAASAAHLAINYDSPIPTIGASGAIAGVMGAYMYLYPHARVLALVPLFLFFFVTVLPASLFLGIWFLLQFFSGVAAITAANAGGVAWWAHIGGFVVGVGIAWLLNETHHLRPRVATVHPGTEHTRFHRGGPAW